MLDTSAGASNPSVKLSPRYLFTDDAIVDAMQLVTALTQLGRAESVKESISGVMRAKRALATEKWTRTAEAEFWTSYAQLAHAAREAGVLNGPIPKPVKATGFVLGLRKLVTFPGAVVVFISLVVMCGWLWAKTLAETIDNDRVNLRDCLVSGSKDKRTDDIVAAIFGDPAKPALTARSDYQRTLTSCAHILAAL